MAGEVLGRAAGRDDVDEAEERRAQGLVGGGEVHRPAVERLEWTPGAGGERGVQLAADLLGLVL